MKLCAGWDASVAFFPLLHALTSWHRVGMGTMHAWESFGDGVGPDIQAVAKGLGGG
jgi:hypothetical protein